MRTTTADNSTRYSVLYWIHGGGYTAGSANAPYYDGHYLVEKYKNLIVVTVNYRLNIFGFLGADQLRNRGVCTCSFHGVSLWDCAGTLP